MNQIKSSVFTPLTAVLFGLCLAPLSILAKETPPNAKLLKMTGPYEALAETIPAGDIKDTLKIEKAYVKVDRLKGETKALLSPEISAQFDIAYSALQDARTKKDSIGSALAAAEIYKLIVSSLDGPTLVVPKEVDLLDYSGFRGTALLKAAKPNWSAVAQNAEEAGHYWKRVRARVTNAALQGAMDNALKNMGDSAKGQDVAIGLSSAQADLDLVDELENFFEGKPVMVK